MLADISNVDAIYIVCRRTDMRKSIDGLCASLKTALLRYGHIIWKRYWLKNWKLLLVETLQIHECEIFMIFIFYKNCMENNSKNKFYGLHL